MEYETERAGYPAIMRRLEKCSRLSTGLAPAAFARSNEAHSPTCDVAFFLLGVLLVQIRCANLLRLPACLCNLSSLKFVSFLQLQVFNFDGIVIVEYHTGVFNIHNF